jgi:hypothetical protein
MKPEQLLMCLAHDLPEVVGRLDMLEDLLREADWEFATEQAKTSKDILKTWVAEIRAQLELPPRLRVLR